MTLSAGVNGLERSRFASDELGNLAEYLYGTVKKILVQNQVGGALEIRVAEVVGYGGLPIAHRISKLTFPTSPFPQNLCARIGKLTTIRGSEVVGAFYHAAHPKDRMLKYN